MDPKEITRKLDRLHDTLEDPHSAYKGAASLNDVMDYIARIHKQLGDAIYDGFEGQRDSEGQLLGRQAAARWAFEKDQAPLMEKLKTGEYYDDYAKMLLQNRLFEEVGPTYKNRDLKIDVGIRLQMHSRALVGYADEFADPHMYFNPEGIVLMSPAIKKAGLSHEAAHVALGHTAASYHAPDDRRKIELDATYVGALIHGDPKAYNELNHLSVDYLRSGGRSRKEELEEFLSRRHSELYQRSGKQPGEDDRLDRRIDTSLGERRYHREYPHKLIYPTIEEKIALVDSIEPPKKSIFGKWTQRRALEEEIRNRHVGTGLGQG